MKISFSLSSLQPLGQGLEKHGQAGVAIERPYNSLTKKRFVESFIFPIVNILYSLYYLYYI